MRKARKELERENLHVPSLPQSVSPQGGNAKTDRRFIFGSVTVCQWPQMRRKGRL